MTGKGSVNHNSRKFHAKNTDPERSCLNVEYCNENIKDVYHELFDEALARYNEKQTRSDRRIDDYYGKICSGKQEKPFHEIILQIGDKDNMGAKTENGQLAVKVLSPRRRRKSRWLRSNTATCRISPPRTTSSISTGSPPSRETRAPTFYIPSFASSRFCPNTTAARRTASSSRPKAASRRTSCLSSPAFLTA